jgi:RNA polymerase sigma-70 factor (ECF subfamily)
MDEALIRRAARGDAEAFDALARDRIDRLYAIAFRILRDPHDAEDAVQQALWTAWGDLPGLRDPARFDAWLYRLLVRMCYRAARSRRRRDVVVRLVPELHDAADPHGADAIAERDALERAFATLSTEHRAVVVLHHHLGLGLDEVAGILEIPYGTARSRAHYAIRRLREALTLDERPAEAAAERSVR